MRSCNKNWCGGLPKRLLKTRENREADSPARAAISVTDRGSERCSDSLFRGDDPFVADLFDDDWRLFLQREPGSQYAEDGEDPALGNQWGGVIVEKGDDVGQFRVGDRVCGYGSIREIQVLDAVDAGRAASRDYPRWDRSRIAMSCWRLLATGAIDCERIIDPVVRFDEAPYAYEEYVDRNPQQSVKLGFALV
jgi:threonine dehydrogenase-like Zn-dependent dehydrogenase